MNFFQLRFIGFACLLSCCLCQTAGAQLLLPQIQSQHFGVENGLSNNRIVDATEDRQGMLWLATLDGLNRFDGYEFLVYGNRNGTRTLLSGDRLDDLTLLPDGRLFIKYYHDIGFAELLHPLTEVVSKVPLTQANGWHGAYLKCYEHAGRLFFIGIDTARLYVHSITGNGGFQLMLSVPHSIAFDASVLMQQGMAFLPAAEPNFYWMLDGFNGLRYVHATGAVAKQYVQLKLPALIKESPALMLTPNKELFVYSHRFNEPVYWVLKDVNALPEKHTIPKVAAQKNVHVLMPFDVSGIATFQIWHAQMKQIALNADWLLPSANRQTLYVNNMLGFSQITTPRSVFKQFLKQTLPPGMAGIEGRGMVALPDKKVFAATEKNGFYMLDLQSGEATPFLITEDGKKMPDMVFVSRSVYAELDSIIWTSEYSRQQDKGAVLRINLRTKTYKRFLLNQFVNHICWLANNRVLAITEPMPNEPAQLVTLAYSPNGVNIQPIILQNVSHYFWKQRPAFTIVAKNGHLWYATDGAVYEIDLSSKKIIQAFVAASFDKKAEQFPLHRVLPVGHTMTLYESKDGNIWMGTNGGGVCIIDPATAACTMLNKENGLADNRVCGIVFDGVDYWFSTWHGISMYNPQQKSFQNFYESDGLTNNECNRFSIMLDKQGHCWVGGLNGFNAFDPALLRRSFSGATLQLVSLAYYTKDASAIQTITANFSQYTTIALPAAQPSLTLKLTFSDLGYVGSNSYAYLLQPNGTGTPGDWKSNGNSRTIIFDNLPAGDYTLQLKGYCGNGSTAANTIVLHIAVADFFYNTWWFRLLMLALVAAVAYVFYRIRLAHALRMEKMRIRISSDLHDEVGGMLSGVAYQMELLAYQAPAENKDVIQQMAASNRYAMSRMRDVVWAIDARKDTLGDLIVKMKETAQEQLAQLQVDPFFVLNNVVEATSMNADIRHNLFLFFREALNNIIKHSQASKVSITCTQQSGWLTLLIEDNGKGFVQPKQHSGQGLSNMEMRVQQMKGRWQIQSKNPGTLIEVAVPL